MAIVECLSRARRQGTAINGGTVRLTDATQGIRVYGRIAVADKTAVNSYRVRVYLSFDNGTTWRFYGGGEHATLGLTFDKATGELTRERPVCLRLDCHTALPADTLVAVECDCPSEIELGIEVEAVAARLRKETQRAR